MPAADAELHIPYIHPRRRTRWCSNDPWVYSAYLGDTVLSGCQGRSPRADHMTQISYAIGTDVGTQRTIFAEVDAATGASGRLTNVHQLDILAGRPQGSSATVEPPNEPDR